MKYLKLILAILLCQAAGVVGSFFTASSVQIWYPALAKPSFNPPSWLFAPVWFILFILMGIALYLVWQARSSQNRKKALLVFLVHLLLNTLWSVLFFGLQNLAWALVDIILLWLMIGWLIYIFYQISRPASYLLLPYLAWVSFAAILNLLIWRLN
jgi:benzodiazapine receptor